MLKYIFIVLSAVMGHVANGSAFYILANSDSAQVSSAANTVNSDSLSVNDSAKAVAKPLATPLEMHGTASALSNAYTYEIKKTDIKLDNYNSAADLLYRHLPVFPLSTGEFFNLNSYSLYAGKARDNAFAFNSRQLTDHSLGMYNPAAYPVEFFESMEVYTGSDAVTLAGNSSGSYVNFREMKYNTSKPYTHLWFAQDAYEFIGSDGVFSQNFAPNWNFTAGYRNTNYDGRFQNSSSYLWNIRLLLRHNPDDFTSQSLSYLFTDHSQRTNGGVDRENSIDANGNIDIYNELGAAVNYIDLNERSQRHDIQFTNTKLLKRDSTSQFDASLFATFLKKRNYSGLDYFFEPTDSVNKFESFSIYTGGRASYSQSLGDIFLIKAGGELTYINAEATPYSPLIDDVNYSLFSRAEFDFGAILLSGGARYAHEYTNDGFSMGARFYYLISDKLKFYFDASYSDRLPTPAEDLSLNSEKNTLFIASLAYKSGDFEANLEAFQRLIIDEIAYTPLRNESGVITSFSSRNAGEAAYTGANLNLSGKIIKSIYFAVKNQLIASQSSSYYDKPFPAYRGTFSAYYEYIINRSLMHAGFELSGMTEFKGMHLAPPAMLYLASDESQDASYNGIDLFVSLRLGNAFVKATFRNLLDAGYYYMPHYPQQDRSLSFSVSWSFDD